MYCQVVERKEQTGAEYKCKPKRTLQKLTRRLKWYRGENSELRMKWASQTLGAGGSDLSSITQIHKEERLHTFSWNNYLENVFLCKCKGQPISWNIEMFSLKGKSGWPLIYSFGLSHFPRDWSLLLDFPWKWPSQSVIRAISLLWDALSYCALRDYMC